LRNPNVHHRVHKRLPPVLTFSRSNTIHASPSQLIMIHYNLPSTPRPLAIKSPHQNPVRTSPIPIRATSSANIIFWILSTE
jgi:hypothetical protein